MSSPAIRIATRQSPLALWQARHIAGQLTVRFGAQVSLVELSTQGDRFLGAPLASVGGKGLFVKEIEQALLDGRADVAVHSLKDMTAQMPPGLTLACVPPREDPRDAFVSPSGLRLAQVGQGASIGTSSLRRACQLLERRSDLTVVALRGNVQTRLKRMEEQNLAGAILALAGLRRLGLEGLVTEVLDPEVSLPAVGQGVLAVQCRSEDVSMRQMLEALEDPLTRIAVEAERALLARLEGGCSVPLGGYATVSGNEVRLRALIGRPDGTQVLRAERVGPAADARAIGEALADELLAKGGEAILAEVGRGQAVSPP